MSKIRYWKAVVWDKPRGKSTTRRFSSPDEAARWVQERTADDRLRMIVPVVETDDGSIRSLVTQGSDTLWADYRRGR